MYTTLKFYISWTASGEIYDQRVANVLPRLCPSKMTLLTRILCKNMTFIILSLYTKYTEALIENFKTFCQEISEMLISIV